MRELSLADYQSATCMLLGITVDTGGQVRHYVLKHIPIESGWLFTLVKIR